MNISPLACHSTGLSAKNLFAIEHIPTTLSNAEGVEMKVEGSHTIKAPRELLYQLLIDPEILQRCVPGCQSLEAAEDGSYKMSLKAGVGSIKGVFTGSIRLDEMREPEHYRMIVDGKGAPGFLKGEGMIDLIEQGEETLVNYSGDVSVGGTIASVGQRMVQSTAKMMAGQFFAAIGAEAAALVKAEESGEYELPKQGFIRNTIRQIRK
ncbi:MAG: carbon monoxide dehydrogenase subunit G [Blastocatellales bacterium]